jgi:FeS assembly protein IscX
MAFGDKPLVWNDASGIAQALAARYPDCDRLALGRDELGLMISGLDGFGDAARPDPRQLDHILWTWMRLAAGGTE